MKKKVVKKSKNFWLTLPKPFFAIAPMANVTDAVFRKLFAKYGKPDVTWTEFVSADGLNSAGKKKLLVDLEYSEKERPVVAQLFTGHPEEMKKAAKLIVELGFDGLDINMGCPDRAVLKQGGGSALIKNPKVALAVLQAAREGVGIIDPPTLKLWRARKLKCKMENCSAHVSDISSIPVSVKTRIGFNTIDLSWIELLLKQRLPALTVHLRTRKEMSEAAAHWEIMPEIVKMRDLISPQTKIIGNGDVRSMAQAREYAEKYGCDGVMIGRGIFGKPWFFNTDTNKASAGTESMSEEKTPEQRLKILAEHAKLFEKAYGGTSLGKRGKKRLKNFDVMKKHFKAYVHGWDGAKELRVKLMATKNVKEVVSVIKEYSPSAT